MVHARKGQSHLSKKIHEKVSADYAGEPSRESE